MLLTVVLLLNVFFNGLNHMTVTTRIAYAMTRDEAIPFSTCINKLNPETKNPDRIVFVVFFLDCLLCFLPLISTTAFAAVGSITTIGFGISYGLPIALRFY